MSEVFVSPDGARMKVSSPAAVIRMRARGWLPESEAAPTPSEPAPTPRAVSKPAPKPESADS